MNDKRDNQKQAPLFRSAVKTLTPAEIAQVTAGVYEPEAISSKPSQIPTDRIGFR